MSEPYLGQIRMFAGNFAPRGNAFCEGQLLPISANSALFSLLGTIYGGDGRTTFALPDLRGRMPVHYGNGPGLSSRPLGEKGGQETVTLTQAQLPSHSHSLQGEDGLGTQNSPVNTILAELEFNGNPIPFYSTTSPTRNMNSNAIGPTGTGQGHNNIMPFQAIYFIIALTGIYPSRN
jgi:microcystin-dependent protein